MTTHSRDDNGEIIAEFRKYRETADRAIRNDLVVRFRWIAVHCATRFAHRGEPVADLVQVAQLGVLKAVERFDPEMGVAFPTYAMPTVLGELRRHFRDATWLLRVPRRPKELFLELNNTIEILSQRLGRSPSVADLATELRISETDVLEALEAGEAYRAASLHHWPDQDDERDDMSRSEALKVDDADLENLDDRVTARAALSTLGERKREIIFLRFYKGMTQQEIGDRLGISQVHVSRLLRAGLKELREQLEAGGHEELVVAAVRAAGMDDDGGDAEREDHRDRG